MCRGSLATFRHTATLGLPLQGAPGFPITKETHLIMITTYDASTSRRVQDDLGELRSLILKVKLASNEKEATTHLNAALLKVGRLQERLKDGTLEQEAS